MIEVYRFKVTNAIGNILTIGRMASTKDEVIEHCEKAIKDARRFTDCKWTYEIELVEVHKKSVVHFEREPIRKVKH